MKSLLGSRLVPSLGLLLTTIWLCGVPHPTARAQVPPETVDTLIVETTRAGLDLGTRTTATVDLNVTTTAITGGSRPDGGSTLFHSFDFFTVGTKDIAHFQNDMMLPTTNIIARVIGDAAGLRQASTIDGILRTNTLNAFDPLNFGSANLFLVNPAGIIFGPNAQLDIKGSFAATTADYLRMTDGALFHIDSVQPSALTIADVASFGFTSPRPVAISVQGSTLAVPIGQSLSMVGGDFTLTSGVLQASGGRIQIASVASSGEVTPSLSSQPPSLDVSLFTQLGSVTESGASNLSVSSLTNPTVGAGTILVRADQLTVDGSGINATTGATNGASVGIDLNVTQKILLINSSVQTATSGAGRAGDIRIQTDSLEANNASILGRALSGMGDGGAIDVNARLVDLHNRGSLQTFTQTGGQAGNITVRADHLETRDGGRIFSGGLGTGSGGDIDVAVKELFGSAQNLANVPNCANCVTGIQAQAGFGSRGGSVRVQADSIQLFDGAGILSQLFSIGPGGNIDVTAKNILLSGSVTVIGPSGAVTQSAAIGSVLSGSFAQGTGGNVTVNAENIEITNNGQIASTLIFGAPGNAGNTTINTGTLNIHDRGGVFASSFLGTGNSGNIDITANAINISGVRTTLEPGGVADFTGLSASTATGRGGTIRVATNDLLVTNKGAIASTTFSSGAAGSINITAADVSVTDAGFITASTGGSGAGGNIDINAGHVLVSGEIQVPGALDAGVAAIAAQAKAGSGNAGTITITADEIDVLNRGIINNDTLTSGMGGTIELKSGLLTVANGGLVSAATRGTGNAGSITLNTNRMSLLNAGQVTSSSVGTATGRAGSITVQGVNGAGNAAQSVSLTGSNTSITSDTDNTGFGGDVQIHAGQVQLADLASITAKTSGAGRAGSIGVTSDNLSLTGGARIEASTSGTGMGGSISLNSAESVVVAGLSTVQANTTGDGAGGNISVQSKRLVVDDFATIRAISGEFHETTGAVLVGLGQSGSIAINSGEAVTITNWGEIVASTVGDGAAGIIDLTTKDLTLKSNGAILALSGDLPPTGEIVAGRGAAGDIEIRVTGNLIVDDAIISAQTLGDGQGGTVTVTAGNIELRNGGILDASTVGNGDAGSMSVQADRILIEGISATPNTNGAPIRSQIDLSTFGDQATTGNAGNLELATGRLELRKGGSITSVTLTAGRGGSLDITADSVFLSTFGSDGSLSIPGVVPIISTQSQGTGPGGAISLHARTLEVLDGSVINTATFGSGNAGDLAVTADHVTVGGENPFCNCGASAIIRASTSGTGSGGTITIVANDLSVSDLGRIDSATARGGNAGNINLELANSLTLSTGGLINASTTGTGKGGTVAISADHVTVAGAITPLGSPIPITSNIVAQTQAANGGDGGSIWITANRIDVLDGGRIRADTFGGGQGGSIVLTGETVTIAGINESVKIAIAANPALATNPDQAPRAQIAAKSDGSRTNGSPTGNGGTVTIVAATLNVQDGGLITTESSSRGTGGSINLTAGSINLSDDARVLANAAALGGAGSILLNTNQLSLLSGSQISSNSTGTQANAGNAGNTAIQGLQGNGTSAQSLFASGTNSLISTNTTGPGQGGNIQINANQMQVEQLAKITAETSGKGKAGNVMLTGDTLTVASGGRIEASTAGEGKGGEIAITTTGDVTVSGLSTDGQTRSGIFAKTQTLSTGTGSGGGGGGGGSGGGSGGGGTTAKPGNAGNITIASKNFLLNGGAQIDSSTTSGGAGGNVSITTTENITIAGSSTRLTSDATRGDGKGGSITLVAKNITVRDAASVTAATGGKGDAGNVTLTALGQLLLQSAGTITTSTSGSGKGGTIVIQASQVLLDGPGTGISADTLRPFADLTITINILHSNDGDLVIQLDSPTGTRVALLSRVGGSGDNFTGTQFNDQTTTQITSGSAPFTGTFKPREPLGQLINELVAGNWTLNVRDQATGNPPGTLESWTLQIGQETFQSTDGSKVIPDNGNARSTITVAAPTVPTVQGGGEAPGIGGNVTVNAGTVTVRNGATMSATTRGSGQGGTLTVNATGPVALAGSGSGLFTDSEASGAGGNVNVQAARMTMDNGAKVSAASSSTGDAGTITINAGSEFLSTNSSITTEASQASGGNITLLATDMIRLRDSRISASVFGGPTTAGGNIFIDPNFIILQNSQIFAQAIQGAGGNIGLTFNQALLTDARSTISASSQFGVNGTVNFNSPAQNLSGALVPLEQSFLSGNTLSNQRCAARMAEGQISTFIVTEREGLSQEPGGMLLSSLVETGGTAESETIEPIRVASVSQSFFTPLTPEPVVQLTRPNETCRR